MAGLFVAGDSSNRTGFLTWNRDFYDCVIRTVLCAETTVDTLIGVDVGAVVINFDCLLRAIDLTGAGKTSLTGICRKIF